jgi:hypothetical protein
MTRQLISQSEQQLMHQDSRELLNLKCDFSLKNGVLNTIWDSTGCKYLTEGNSHQKLAKFWSFH